MKYQLIGSNDYFLDPVEAILNNRGVKDRLSFLDPDKSHTHDWRLLGNIDKAADCLISHIEKGSKIFVQQDSDADGITSTAELINYLKKVFPKINIQWRIHEGKEHGVIVDTVPNDVQLVIIPDAGSNQYEEHGQLKERGMDVIVLDHHECERVSKDAIVVNNQLSPNYPNKTLTGAGIVYKFLQALDDKLGINHADHYLDLVAIGLIGDMADSRNLETRYYMQKGLSNINNTFLKALYKKQEFSTKGIVNIVNTQFYIVPLINACVRSGNLQEKLQMFNAFLESKEQIYYERKKEYVDIQSDTARVLTNIRSRQNKLRDKGVKAIEERIKERNLLENKVLIVNITGILDKNLTGLVANRLAKEYKRCVMLLRQREEQPILSGSIRGYDKGVIKDFKKFLLNTNKFEFVEGHANAAGCQIEAEKLLEVNSLINEQLKDVEINTDIHEVDFIIPAKQLTTGIVKDISKLRDIWGFMAEEPLIAIKEIEVSKEDVLIMGTKKNTLKFTYRDIEFIKFFSNEDEHQNIIDKGETLVIDVVGKFSINSHDGKDKAQVVIDDYEVVKAKKKTFVF